MFPRLALAVAWLACAIGVAIHALATVDDAPSARAKTSSVSCAACALVARDVAFVARHATRDALDARSRELEGNDDDEEEANARYEVRYGRGDATIGSPR